MSYYPVFLQLEGKTALVVGGGKVALRKVETLLNYGASVHLVAKELSPELKQLIEDGDVLFLGEVFREIDLKDIFLIIAATDDKALNRRVSKTAREKGLLVNVADQPSDCNFILPSIVKRGDLSIAISTSGRSPALAKKIRTVLERQFGAEYEAFLVLMGYLREEVLSIGLPQEENRRIFFSIVESGIIEALSERDWDRIESILLRLLPRAINIKNIIKKLQ